MDDGIIGMDSLCNQGRLTVASVQCELVLFDQFTLRVPKPGLTVGMAGKLSQPAKLK